MPPQTLTESIWWISPGQLAGMQKPAVHELPSLQAAGIGAIVSVMDDPANLDWYQDAAMPHLWLPTTGGTAPTVKQVDDFWAFATAQLAAERAVAVHCSSGRRRTATFLGAYLIRSGATYEAAIAAIAQANPTVEMRAAQLDFLQSMAANTAV
ncbi:MAG: dual specificity protein phosphatase family protein [Leptolyngbyaceae cyanobacterium]